MSNPRSLPGTKQFAIHVKHVFRRNAKNASMAIGNLLGVVLDAADWGFTWIRTLQVFTAVDANGGQVPNGDDVTGSLFNNLTHEGGDPSAPLTPVGWSFAGVMGGSLFAGFIRAGYRAHRVLRLNSYAYIEKRMQQVDKKIGFHPTISHFNTVINYGTQLLDSDKIAGGRFYQIEPYEEVSKKLKFNGQVQTLKETHRRKYIDIAKKIDADSLDLDFRNLYVREEEKKEKYQPNAFIRFINKISTSKPANVLSYIGNWASNHAFLFWIVWMPFALAAGAAATFTLPFLPIIVGITLGIGAIFSAFKAIEMALNARRERALIKKIDDVLTHVQHDENDKFAAIVLAINAKKIKLKHIAHLDASLKAQYEADKDAEVKIDDLAYKVKLKVIAKITKDLETCEKNRAAHIQAELRQRVFMKYEHAATMEKIKHLYHWKLEQTQSFNESYKKSFSSSIKEQAVEASRLKLKNHLRANNHGERQARLAVGVINSVILGFILPLFILWLASSIVSVPVLLGVVALAGVASFLGGSMLYTVGGAILGTVFGIQSVAQRRQAQLEFDERVNNLLSARYKNEKIGKATKFCQLESAVNAKIAQIRQTPLLLAKLKHHGYDVKKIDVYNDYYFEKQKDQPSGWTWIKKGANRVYQFLGGGQTGALITRCLFLAGCVFAPALAALAIGGPIAFVAVAIVMAVIVGSLRVAQYQLEAKQKHREFFADTIDARISYLKKKDKELTAILDSENKADAPAVAPANDQIIVAEEESETASEVENMDEPRPKPTGTVVIKDSLKEPLLPKKAHPALKGAGRFGMHFHERTCSWRESLSRDEIAELNPSAGV